MCIRDSPARHSLKSMERLLRERECDVSNRAAVCRLQSFARHGRAGDVASCSLVSKSLDSAQNAGVGLARLTQLAEALKRRYLAPIRLQNSLGQTGDRDRELVIGVVGKVLDLSLIHISEPTRPY